MTEINHSQPYFICKHCGTDQSLHIEFEDTTGLWHYLCPSSVYEASQKASPEGIHSGNCVKYGRDIPN